MGSPSCTRLLCPAATTLPSMHQRRADGDAALGESLFHFVNGGLHSRRRFPWAGAIAVRALWGERAQQKGVVTRSKMQQVLGLSGMQLSSSRFRVPPFHDPPPPQQRRDHPPRLLALASGRTGAAAWGARPPDPPARRQRRRAGSDRRRHRLHRPPGRSRPPRAALAARAGPAAPRGRRWASSRCWPPGCSRWRRARVRCSITTYQLAARAPRAGRDRRGPARGRFTTNSSG